jgi:hypothetical protein
MFKLSFLPIIFFLFSNTFILAQKNGYNYEDKKHNFKINFFQKPVFKVDTAELQGSPLYIYNWENDVIDTLHSNSYYSLSLSYYPAEFMHSDSSFTVVESFINSSQNSFLENKDLTLLSSTLTVKKGYPGKIFKWKRNVDNVFFEIHIYLIQNKLFELLVICREGKNHNNSIHHFIDSFEPTSILTGKFSIPNLKPETILMADFPGTPKEQSQMVDSEFGKLFLTLKSYEPTSQDSNILYMSGETAYEKEPINQGDTYSLNKFYKNAIDGSINSINGQLISISDINIEGHLGKEYKAYTTDHNVIIVYRMLYLDKKMFLLGVITPFKNDKNPAMLKFLNSFRLKK